MARFIRGELQAGVSWDAQGDRPWSCLVVRVTSERAMAIAWWLITFGEIVTAPFEFISETGVV